MRKLVIAAAAAVVAGGIGLGVAAPAHADDDAYYCGNGVMALGPTSCPFALSVEAAWYNRPGMSNIVRVYSPVTGYDYWMNCVATSRGVICRGGDDAAVWIF